MTREEIETTQNDSKEPVDPSRSPTSPLRRWGSHLGLLCGVLSGALGIFDFLMIGLAMESEWRVQEYYWFGGIAVCLAISALFMTIAVPGSTPRAAKVSACLLIPPALLFGLLGASSAFGATYPAMAGMPPGLVPGRIPSACLSINALASAGVILSAALRLLRNSPRTRQLAAHAAVAHAITLAGTASVYGVVVGYVSHAQSQPWDATDYYGLIGALLLLAMGCLVRAQRVRRCNVRDDALSVQVITLR